ncbi:MAG TPA: FAD-dependent oxidoreductase, partial [Actinomycetaceae bacterium]|nr:FAD-dependent oxidoreductase [Actinomycetaceae bacterium]
MTNSSPVRDVVIIGSGPAGWTAAVYAARADLAPVVIAGSVTAGGALMNTTEVENFPGFPEGVMGPDLMMKMQEQAERFGAETMYDDAIEVELDGPVKTIKTAEGEVLRSRSVILANGSAYRELGVEGEPERVGRG